MYERKIQEDLDCGIIVAMKVFGAKWKPCIIDAISRGAKRPSELHREITNTSPRVIDMQLSELVAYEILSKTIHPGFPLCVEYSLTELGESILPILARLNEWGIKNKEIVKKVSNQQNVNEDLTDKKNKWSTVSSVCQ
ncbi:helix-turn-helix transcriptional regulator [Niastella caeni]|uniref:Helix-turn-helix transcriptional regulator n=1 Tax=Niastella caeni TaxID=2569763 RepID=A0A4S8HFS1_9BACT|nr:helix-turn-helix domain-containing protein [Niastella caeni]THU32969.1 helix-turn-helix transcriptional regulator [Niastella caeni]